VTWQLDALALIAERVQVFGLKLPNPPLLQVGCPLLKNGGTLIGGIRPDAAMSLTITVQVVGWPTTTGLGAHDLLMLTGSMPWVCVMLAG